MDKVVRSDYRSGSSNLFPFIDSDPLIFIWIIDLHFIGVLSFDRRPWRLCCSSPTWVCCWLLFCFVLRVFSASCPHAYSRKLSWSFCELNIFRIHCFAVSASCINFSIYGSNLTPHEHWPGSWRLTNDLVTNLLKSQAELILIGWLVGGWQQGD